MNVHPAFSLEKLKVLLRQQYLINFHYHTIDVILICCKRVQWIDDNV